MPKSKLAMSFVVTAAAASLPGCGGAVATASGGGHGSGGGRETGGGVYQQADTGECFYFVNVSCPENATCNPPPPQPAYCPSGDPDIDPSKGDTSDVSLPEGWVRIKPEIHPDFYAEPVECHFEPDMKCPIGDTPGTCSERRYGTVPCQLLEASPNEPDRKRVEIEAFSTKRVDGSCARYPKFECVDNQECVLPDNPEPVDCDTQAR